MIDVTDATFEESVLKRSFEVPVVVDLWAPWCGPCKTLGPILERVVAATGGAVELVKVNVDENPSVSAELQGPVHPGRLRRAGRSRGRPVHRGPARSRGAGLSSTGLAPVQSEADLLADGRGRRR